MTSERKIAANRLNAKKSRGPRTAAGKSLASRNALRHGLRAITHRHPTPSSEIERFAKAICGADNDPLLFEQACVIAENDFVLRAIHAQQLAVVERVREVTASALAKGDNSLALAKARSLRSRLAYNELVALRDKLLQQYKDELPDSAETQAEQLIPGRLAVFLLDKEESSDQMEREAGVRNQADERIDERDEFLAPGGSGPRPHPAGPLRASGLVAAKACDPRFHEYGEGLLRRSVRSVS
jgi:hypothetical protein